MLITLNIAIKIKAGKLVRFKLFSLTLPNKQTNKQTKTPTTLGSVKIPVQNSKEYLKKTNTDISPKPKPKGHHW